MVARVKSTRFGCMLAASLFVLVLAGCGDVSESGSSQMAHPSKQSPPPETADSHAAGGGGSANCKPTQPDMLGPFYEPGAPVRTSVGSGYVLSGTVLGATECKPIPNAHIEFWLANPRGDYDDAHRATVFAGEREEGTALRATCRSPVSVGLLFLEGCAIWDELESETSPHPASARTNKDAASTHPNHILFSHATMVAPSLRATVCVCYGNQRTVHREPVLPADRTLDLACLQLVLTSVCVRADWSRWLVR